LRKRATMYRKRSIGLDPEIRAFDLEHANRLDRIARGLERGERPPIKQPT
jgi:hypothetical protein